MIIIYVIRCGIGTLSRNRSRAGSVDESFSRTLCRSVTPIRCNSAAQFNDKVAATLPRNFETNIDSQSEKLNQKEESKEKSERRNKYISDGTSNTSGKNL